jgi:hypothetical protein
MNFQRLLSASWISSGEEQALSCSFNSAIAKKYRFLPCACTFATVPIGYRRFVWAMFTPAIAYLRTSSATNVGADKDSDKRQREAIASFAKRSGCELVGEYYDSCEGS